MSFKLPDLPYAPDALEPVIDQKTMEIHHGKHHQGYVNNLNNAIGSHADLERKDLDELVAGVASTPKEVQTAVRNNGGGHWNHSLFWTILAPKGDGGEPSEELAAAIEGDLGGMDQFKGTFENAATGRFGSGWAWLIVNDAGKLEVTSTPNQDNPLMRGLVDKAGTPILGIDVWEHAYYLNYQNRRGDYVEAFWDIVNWDAVSRNFKDATA